MKNKAKLSPGKSLSGATERLAALNAMLKGKESEKAHDFLNFFVGSLSVFASDDGWNKSLEIAKKCLKDYSQDAPQGAGWVLNSPNQTKDGTKR